jgi:biopolymer transport protein ExbD
MRFSRKKKQHGDVSVVITSLLDINFLLIMFFLMTAHFQRETHARLDLPKEMGEEHPQADEAGIVINISATGEIIVLNETVDLETLKQMVLDRSHNRTSGVTHLTDPNQPLKLMIRADRNARTQDLNRVVLMLRETGVGAIRIATEMPK